MVSMALSHDYEGVFYCVKCCAGRHFLRITAGDDRCECGSRGWKSDKDYDLKKIIAEWE